LDKEGKKLWQKTIGGSEQDIFSSMTSCTGGGYVLAGTSRSNDADATGNHGDYDFWAVKVAESGTILWQKQLGGSKQDVAASITAGLDGGYVIAGSTDSKDGDVKGQTGASNAWIVKLDGAGTKVWQQALGGTHKFDRDGASAVITSLDGGYVILGRTYRNADEYGSFGNNDILVAKFDADGGLIWRKAIGGSGIEHAETIVQSADGGYVIAGNAGKGDDNSDDSSLLIKLDKDGNVVWQKTVAVTVLGAPQDMIAISDGGFLITGLTLDPNLDDGEAPDDPDVLVTKIDSNGNILWQKTMGGSGIDGANSLLQRWDGSFVIAGSTDSNDGDVKGNQGLNDAWVFTVRDK
jgi:hypothetical protein